MKRTTIIVLSGLTLIFFFYLEAFAVFDPPHNEASSVSCGSCHGKSLEIAGGSPFWTDNNTDTAYNAVCLRCHITTEAEAEGIGYSGNSAPVVKSHAPGGTAIKCTVCHHNHEQEQIYPGKYNQGNFFVATGSVDSIDTYDLVNNTTTINYSSLAGKNEWADLVNLAAKTGASRGAMLVPDISATSSRWPVYMIAGIDIDPDSNPATPEGTITVKGELISASNLGIFYGQQVRSIMRIASGTKFVEFYNNTGTNSFVNPTPPYNGICQVCHENQGANTGIKYWRNDGTGISHNTGKNCMECHLHAGSEGGTKGGFNHNGSDDCNACHSDHHTSSNAAVGNCEYCHADPRPSMVFWDDFLPGDNGSNSATYVPTQMACRECHVNFSNGKMEVYKFTRPNDNYVTYVEDYDREVIHEIPAVARINNYGICFSCHNGSIAAAVKVWHARPDKHSSSWVYGVSDDRRCTGSAGNDSDPNPPTPLSWAEHVAGRSSGTIGSFNLFRDPGFGYTPDPSWADPCTDREIYSTPDTASSFTRIAIPAVPGNGNTSGSVPVFPNLCPMTPDGEDCPLQPPVLTPEPDTSCADNCSVTLNWGAVTNPDGGEVGYQIVVDDNANFSSPIYTSGWITSTSAPLAPLATDKTYYWHVRARKNGDPPTDMSVWSSKGSFKLMGPATVPGVPTLAWPPDNYLGQVGFPEGENALRWNASVNGTQYNCEVKNWGGAVVAVSGWITATSFNPGDLSDNTDYTWRVQARTAFGIESTWSETREWFDDW